MAKIKSPLTVLRLAFNLFKFESRSLLYPFVIIVFINLALLEVLYFFPRWPLSTFFGPVISRLWGQGWLHYPMNLALVPKLFYYAQVVLFLFVTSLLTATIAKMVSNINNEEPVSFRAAFMKSLPGYVYIVLYSLLSLSLFNLFGKGYGLLIHRAARIQATEGLHFWLKKAVFEGAPYAQFLYSIIITALLIYIPVLIVVEKKKILAAFFHNFKLLFGSFWTTLMLVFVPMLFYVPFLVMQENMGKLVELTWPEIQIIVLALSVFATAAINMVIMASATTYYLYKKETS